MSSAQLRDLARLVATTAVALGLGMLATAGVLASQGKSVTAGFTALYEGSFGTEFAIGNTLNKGAALLLVALAFIVAKRAGLISIGGEGQIYAGGLGAVAMALGVRGAPGPVALTAAVLAGMAAGALWGGLAGWLRAHLDVNETISTLLLNFIALHLVTLAVLERNLLREPVTSSVSFPQSEQLPTSVRLPRLFPGTSSRAQFGVVLALLAVVAVVFVLRRTTLGYRLRMLGHSPAMAARSGVHVKRLTVGAMAISGALAGLAGTSITLGEQFRLKQNFSPGFGFDGIAVALVARDSPIGAVFVAVLFGALRAGGGLLSAEVQVPQSVVLVVQGTIIVAVAAVAPRLRRARVTEDTEAARAETAETTSASPVEAAR